eukprot:COSAG04_NODE_231_length_19199_cov_263.690209_23_plen_102_part_00
MKMNNKFGVEEAPDWRSEELAAWAKNQRTYGKAFKKPASERSKTEKTNAGKTTERRTALLDGIGFSADAAAPTQRLKEGSSPARTPASCCSAVACRRSEWS